MVLNCLGRGPALLQTWAAATRDHPLVEASLMRAGRGPTGLLLSGAPFICLRVAGVPENHLWCRNTRSLLFRLWKFVNFNFCACCEGDLKILTCHFSRLSERVKACGFLSAECFHLAVSGNGIVLRPLHPSEVGAFELFMEFIFSISYYYFLHKYLMSESMI